MSSTVNFSIVADAAWAPGVDTPSAWAAWAQGDLKIGTAGDAPVKAMAPMLRRRAGAMAKMALEVAYRCLGERRGVASVFCSRHGEVDRSVSMLTELAENRPLSPTSFGMSVHNAVGGLFSIARGDRANHIALAAGQSSVEHGVIEACALLADGEPLVLLVVYDSPLPTLYGSYQDCDEKPFAWAWLMAPAGARKITLAWAPTRTNLPTDLTVLPCGLEVWRFYVRREQVFERLCDGRRWLWSQDV